MTDPSGLSFDLTNLLLAGCLILLLLNLLRGRRSGAAKPDPRIESLQRDVRALTTAAVGMGERVLEVERRQRRLAEKQESLDLFDSANQPYEQAIHLARQGVDAEELVATCGLSHSEAELIAIMHRLEGDREREAEKSRAPSSKTAAG